MQRVQKCSSTALCIGNPSFIYFLFKGIVSRKFDMLLLVLLESEKFCTHVLLYPFLKISSFSCLILDYNMFGGDFLLSHFSVNDSCYGSDGRAKEGMRE
jgi:hypothetical protein